MKTPDLWFEPCPWIDGGWQRATESFAVRDPATGQVLANVARAHEPDVRRAVDGAARGFETWKRTPAATRGDILKRAAALLLEHRERLAWLLSAEQGKPYAQAMGEVEYAASFFQWFGEEARRLCGRIAPHPSPDREFYIDTKPAGVVGLITPWNFPLAQGAKKVAAALAAGCTAVWKPAELTPLIALAMGPLLEEAGLPGGALQIVPGKGSVVGAVLTQDSRVAVLSLTGSTETGQRLMAQAAQGIKRVSLELGGNAPFIVLPDADLDFTVDELARLKMLCSGQVCVTANRVFVHESIEAEFTALLAQRIMQARLGHGLDEGGVDCGPLIHPQASAGVARLVAEACAAGATLVCENRDYEKRGGLQQGSFHPLTVLSGVSDDMGLAREEIFGPVVPVLRYDNVEEVVRRANATPFGLAGYVYGRDHALLRWVASHLDAGIVGVNEWRPLKAENPFGGIKLSGIGAEGGQEGIREFCETQVISFPRPALLPFTGDGHA